ncbi:MAG TPA: ribonuclease H-like domain-containing protein [Actinomycetota bacterium]|nr:ribonuclease H-like domain-containing protein [Actinomycetota bacterium]
MIAYLDIETAFDGRITVVGVLVSGRELVQLVGTEVTGPRLAGTLGGVDTLCTYYGEGFDLPVLERQLGLDLLSRYRSIDLATLCRTRRLRGGLKGVEATLGIGRTVSGLNGIDAMQLWDRWERGDRGALDTLLAYNADDVVNLAVLERRLRGDLSPLADPARVVVGA